MSVGAGQGDLAPLVRRRVIDFTPTLVEDLCASARATAVRGRAKSKASTAVCGQTILLCSQFSRWAVRRVTIEEAHRQEDEADRDRKDARREADPRKA